MSIRYNSVNEYIQCQPQEHHQQLDTLRATILKHVPVGTKELIAYNMPSYYKAKHLIHFALYKHHIGIFVGAFALQKLADKLTNYKQSKSSIHLPFNKDLPESIIQEVIKINAGMESTYN